MPIIMEKWGKKAIPFGINIAYHLKTVGIFEFKKNRF